MASTTLGSQGIQLPVGTTAQRPSSAAGLFRHNSSTNYAEYYDSNVGQWIPLRGMFMGVEVLSPWNSYSGDEDVARSEHRGGASGTWTRPAGCRSVLVYVTGGGGGGQHSGNSTYRGCVGGGGGTAVKWVENVASSVSYTVGGGGTGAVGGSSSGNDGGTSSFGSYCTGYGGKKGRDSQQPSFIGMPGGAASGDLNIPGGGGGFNHQTGVDQPQGGGTYWSPGVTSRHRANSDNLGYNETWTHGRWGSGGKFIYDYSGISDSDSANRHSSGGTGVIVIYKYS